MEEEGDCLICAEVMDGVNRIPAVGMCNHKGVCSICFLRMRSLLQDFTCPICKCELEFVIGTGQKQLKEGKDSYEHFTVWGEDAGREHVFDHKSKMFFPTEYHKSAVEKLRVCKCGDCGAWKRDMGALRHHVIKEHNKSMCALCIEHKKVFPTEHTIYTPALYDRHLKLGDQDGSEGHPKCLFCNKRYYDKNMLFSHLEKDHFSCHICVKNGIKFKYYKDYEDLENHFRQVHYICEERSCLEKRFVVFGNNIDYVAHMQSWHPTLQVNRSIPLSFKSYGTEDQEHEENWIDNFGESASESFIGSSAAKYDGGVGGRENNGEWQVLMPQGARDPREAMRRAAREEGKSEQSLEHTFVATEYPTLQGDIKSAAGGERKVDSWNKKGSGAQTEEYPALMGSERKAPLGNSRMSNWGARIKIDKKLSVRKSSLSFASTSHVSGSSVEDANRSAPLGYSLQQQIDRQLQDAVKKPSKASRKPHAQGVAPPAATRQKAEVVNIKHKNSDELTLAEKIRIEQLIKEDKEKKAQSNSTSKSSHNKKENGVRQPSTVSTYSTKTVPPPLPPGLGLFAPPPIPQDMKSTKEQERMLSSTQSSLTSSSVKSSGMKSVAVSTTTPKKKISKPNSSTATGGWGAALSADGLATTKKKKVVNTGLTVVKKSSPSTLENTPKKVAPTAVSNRPPPPSGYSSAPPGFDHIQSSSLSSSIMHSQSVTNKEANHRGNLTDTDFPSFSSNAASDIGKRSQAISKGGAEKWTKVPSTSKVVYKKSPTPTESTTTKSFPGQWVPSIGGSGGKSKKDDAKESVQLCSSDFPSFSSVTGKSSGNAKVGAPKSKKIAKNNFVKLS